MNHLTRPLPADHEIVLISDIHHGLLASSPHVFESAKERIIKGKNTFAAFLGDQVEGRSPQHDYYDVIATDPNAKLPIKQAEHMASMIRPFAKKVLSYGIGNHEWDVIRRAGDVYKSIICDSLKIPYGGFACRLSIKYADGKPMYKSYLTHGWGQISTTADDPVRQQSNMILSLKRKLKNKSADCILMAMGHVHKLLVSKPSRTLYLAGTGRLEHRYLKYSQTADYIPESARWYVCSGGSLRTFGEGYETYSELAGYDPVEIGYPVVIVRNGIIQDVERIVV